jgi:carbamoylphosphate synthase small subunit
VNQACFDHLSNRCYLTSQNHGYAVDKSTLPEEWGVYFSNLHDGSCEGLYHKEKPFFGVQFHPESCPGPQDTSFLFEKFIRLCQEAK